MSRNLPAVSFINVSYLSQNSLYSQNLQFYAPKTTQEQDDPSCFLLFAFPTFEELLWLNGEEKSKSMGSSYC